MKIDIQSPHFTAGEQLISFATEKVNKLSHFYPGIMAAEVCLNRESRNVTENKISEIRLIIPGNDLFAKKQATTFEEAIDQTVDALKEQIRKQKIESYEMELYTSEISEKHK